MNVSDNISKLYIIKFSKWFMLYMPIIGLYYSEHGLNASDLFVLQAAYSLSSGVFEIPSGYMADVVGRKKTIVLGSTMGAFGFFIYTIFPGFWFFLVAEIIMGIGQSFISGADSAMLYDSLKHSKSQDKYISHEGRMNSLGGFAETGAAMAGGAVAVVLSLHSVFLFQIIIAAIAIPAAIMLVEPKRSKLVMSRSFRQIFDISIYAMFKNKQLSSVIFMSSLVGLATLLMAWTIQAYFVELSMSEETVSFIWVLLNLTVAVVSLFAAWLLRKAGIKKLLVLIMIIVPLTYIIMGVAPFMFALPALFVFYIIRGYATPLLKDLVQENCDSDIRATILSVRGLIIRLGFGLLAPVIGFFSGVVSLQYTILGIGILFSVLLTASYIRYRLYNSKK